MRKATMAVVVPAYNEDQVIEASLLSLIKAVPDQHIYVVSDGSNDATAKIAGRLVPNVLRLKKNRGKAAALAALLKKYQLTERYQYIFFFDADTRLHPDFVREVKKVIKAQKPACTVGTVTSDRNKFISAYRVYEYGFSHMFFKNAQNVMGTIIIAPGCASVYRADVLAKLDFSQRTLTEDMDLTLQIHRKRLGKIVYCPRAKVITQDPTTFKDYWHQVNRWNTGFWQNFFLHRLYIPTTKVSAETLLLLGDFLWWIFILILAVSRPLLLLALYDWAIALSMVLAITVSVILKQFWAIPYTPFYVIFHFTNLLSFIFSFFRAVFSRSDKLTWHKIIRYAPN